MEHAIEARGRIGDHRFLDVHHIELIADPLGTMHRIYNFLGLRLDEKAERMMKEWQASNRSGAHGIHTYSSADFGLSDEQIRSDFSFYIDHFGVAVEDKR
jgi:hypothetical protein